MAHQFSIFLRNQTKKKSKSKGKFKKKKTENWKNESKIRVREHVLHEKTRAAAAPRKPKNGAVSSPLKVDMFSCSILQRNGVDLRNFSSFFSAEWFRFPFLIPLLFVRLSKMIKENKA